jgi:isopentenyl-diphosphate delta-isomerase
MGKITGPRPAPCPPGCTGTRRFLYAAGTLIYHEVALFVTLCLIIALTWQAQNQIAAWTFGLLFVMRLSAKFNIFLGVPNLSQEFFPAHLAHLKSYLPKRSMNPLMPFSLIACTAALVWLALKLAQAYAQGAPQALGLTIITTLAALGTLEHIFMISPLPDAALWRWAMPKNEDTMIPAIGDDGTLYPIAKMEAHRRGLLHEAVSVFVFDGENLLIQQRALGKYHCGGQWANTCCTHPHWGESLDAAAHRRLREELGLDLVLTRAGNITYQTAVTDDLIEHERVQIYVARVNKADLRLVLDTNEVAATNWQSIPTLTTHAKSDPQTYAPWFRIYLARWADLKIGV